MASFLLSLRRKPVRKLAPAVPYLLLLLVLVTSVLAGVGGAANKKKPPSPRIQKRSPPPKPSKPPPSPRPMPPKPPKPPSKPPPSPKPSKPPPKIKPQKSPPPLPPSPRPQNITSNGLRLVHGFGTTGRLEVKVAGNWMIYSGYRENGGWAPLCDDYTLSEQKAQVFCRLLGFQYGRQYHGEGVSTYRADETTRPTPLGWLTCTGTGMGPNNMGLPDQVPAGYINIPRGTGVFCEVYPVSCGRQVLVALQCSDVPLPPASSSPPPRPPSPPPPPPPPPLTAPYIRNIDVEDNLLPGAQWSRISRVELLVNSSADGRTGQSVWAPLCASAADVAWLQNQEATQDDSLANIACHQANDWFSGWGYHRWAYQGVPLRIPSGPPPPSTDDIPLFDPTRFTHWVTVVGGGEGGGGGGSSLRMIQELTLQVTTTPCPTGYMYSVRCLEAIA